MAIALRETRFLTDPPSNFRSGAKASSLLVILLVATALFALPPSAENQEPELKGQLLVASSRIVDPRFQKTVILIAGHDENGTIGLIVNKPGRKVAIGELLEQAAISPQEKEREILIHYGGPVAPDHMFFLHSTDVALESSHTVVEGIALSTDLEILRLIAGGKGPQKYLLFLGYSGWAPQQLEGELSIGSWITVDTDLSLVFAEEPEKTWELIMKGHRL